MTDIPTPLLSIRVLCAPAYEPAAKFPVKVEHGGIWVRDDR